MDKWVSVTLGATVRDRKGRRGVVVGLSASGWHTVDFGKSGKDIVNAATLQILVQVEGS